jgi:hypothetical protein
MAPNLFVGWLSLVELSSLFAAIVFFATSLGVIVSFFIFQFFQFFQFFFPFIFPLFFLLSNVLFEIFWVGGVAKFSMMAGGLFTILGIFAYAIAWSSQIGSWSAFIPLFSYVIFSVLSLGGLKVVWANLEKGNK